jgi:hypothetical protein
MIVPAVVFIMIVVFLGPTLNECTVPIALTTEMSMVSLIVQEQKFLTLTTNNKISNNSKDGTGD